jgi:hypothetical protein
LTPKKVKREQVKKQMGKIGMDKTGSNKTPIFTLFGNPIWIHGHRAHPARLLHS